MIQDTRVRERMPALGLLLCKFASCLHAVVLGSARARAFVWPGRPDHTFPKHKTSNTDLPPPHTH